MVKIVFMGTPEFAVPSLEALAAHFGVALVLTQPDKEKGRGKKVIPSPVKAAATRLGIPVRQPVSLRRDGETVDLLRELAPDFIIVVAYGQILSEEVLAIPKFGCVNLHASLLPRLRGAAPLNWCLIEGHGETGNTTMLMEKGLDTGPMLLKDILSLDDTMDYGMVHDALSQRGGKLLIDTVEGILEGRVQPVPQEDADSTYAPMLTKEVGAIDWSKDARTIHNLVRGLAPVPAAYAQLGDQRVKILKTEVREAPSAAPGTILSATPEGILVATGSQGLLIRKLQVPNKKPMWVRDYLNGHTVTETAFN